MRFPFLLHGKGEKMSNLRTNYKDDVFTGKRKYSEIDNGDGTISFDDVTDYAQVGDTYGAAQINETNDVINNLDSKTYKSTDGAETGLADNDYFPFYDSSASTTKKTLWSNIKSILSNAFAPKAHAVSSGTYGTGSDTLYGHVKLSDNYTSSAGGAASAVGASSKAVYDSYSANRNAITSLSGTVTANQQTESQHYNSLNNGKAPNNHASSSTTYGKGSVEKFGHLKISDDYEISRGTANDGMAASSYAVNGVYNITNRTEQNLSMLGNTVGDYYREFANELTANNNRIYMDYQNGKYGYNTAANRGADTFHPFNTLEEVGSGSVIYDVNGMSSQYEDSYPMTLVNGNWYIVYVGGNTGNNFFLSNFDTVLSKGMAFQPWPDRWAGTRVFLGKATNNSVVLTCEDTYLPENTKIWVVSLE